MPKPEMRRNTLLWLLLAIVVSRLLTMAIVPLTDTTEARYGEIARIMAESGDFITPWFDYGVPFWGKPPLSFWTEAIAFKVFGVSEFSVRLPSLLATAATAYLLYILILDLASRRQALIGAVIYASMVLSYLMSGAVLTDPFLTLGTTLAFVAFILALRHPRSIWRWHFFVGLVIGLLAKGPLVLVLIGGPLFLWLLWRRRWRDLLSLPWFRGTLLTATLTLPWYIAAELKTPGFIDYFIVGEHFRRFLDSGWQGDLYGSAHQQPFGMIWLYWLVATLPWGLLALYRLIRFRFVNGTFGFGDLDDWQRLLLLTALFPGLFFTVSGNILWTYQLPALGPLAILLALFLFPAAKSAAAADSGANSSATPLLWFNALLIPLLFTIAGCYLQFEPNKLKSEKSLVAYYQAHRDSTTPPLIYIAETPPFSGRYYSHGKAIAMSADELDKRIQQTPGLTYYCAVDRKALDEFMASQPGAGAIVFRNKRYDLITVTFNQ
jgi:4-amino-4-deoxy-L-arabinose transferase-like glycosyltransferase